MSFPKYRGGNGGLINYTFNLVKYEIVSWFKSLGLRLILRTAKNYFNSSI